MTQMNKVFILAIIVAIFAVFAQASVYLINGSVSASVAEKIQQCFGSIFPDDSISMVIQQDKEMDCRPTREFGMFTNPALTFPGFSINETTTKVTWAIYMTGSNCGATTKETLTYVNSALSNLCGADVTITATSTKTYETKTVEDETVTCPTCPAETSASCKSSSMCLSAHCSAGVCTQEGNSAFGASIIGAFTIMVVAIIASIF